MEKEQGEFYTKVFSLQKSYFSLFNSSVVKTRQGTIFFSEYIRFDLEKKIVPCLILTTLEFNSEK